MKPRIARARAGRPALFCPLWPARHRSGGPTGVNPSPPVIGLSPQPHLGVRWVRPARARAAGRRLRRDPANSRPALI